MTRIQQIKRVFYIVPVLGAVVFGTAQAVASPTTLGEEAACTPKQCLLYCGEAGGVCSSAGYCICR